MKYLGNVLEIAEVCDQTRLSKPTIYKLMKQGEFPLQVRLSSQRVVWSVLEVENWLAQKADERAVSNAEIAGVKR